MRSEEIMFSVLVYESIDELNKEHAFLIKAARAETQFAYAPYSNFNVGAVAKLINGEIVKGTNQENASYPAGICAERTLLSVASSLFPGIGIETIAISYHNQNGESNRPVSPCGICRQSFSEFQQRTQHPIRILLSGMEGEIQVIENANSLLPMGFGAIDLK